MTTHGAGFPKQLANGFYQSPGITLTFESDQNFPLAFESLEYQRSGIELLSVTRTEDGRTIASVHVPDEKISFFIKRIDAFREDGKNKKLIANISNIRLATLRELWTDQASLYPGTNVPIAWEVWLRRHRPQEQELDLRGEGHSDEDDEDLIGNTDPLDLLRAAAPDVGLEVISNPLEFVDRTVILVRGTREQLALGADILGTIAEVRKARTTAEFFSNLRADEQHEWSDDLLGRLSAPPADAPVIGLLDTGVTHGHPLLAAVLQDDDVQSLKPAWGVHDTDPRGHGTPMAGLAIYGDLTRVLDTTDEIVLTHRLQSLKLIHDRDPHRPDLYGAVTIEGVSRLEVDPRRRIYCMAITADDCAHGRPSSWSAAIDDLASGVINDMPRLVILSAGNTPFEDRGTYPDSNETACIQDPAQAWNALTVGGYTEKTFIDQQRNPGWTPLAEHGGLAPASTTSVLWPNSPKPAIKPDIVMEAGNMANHPTELSPDLKDELLLLSTSHQFAAGHRPFTTMQDTSAAAALAANLAARASARYPDFTPETLRALMVHSGHWTEAMRAHVSNEFGAIDTNRLLKIFGYGVPDETRLFSSANNALTLIVQDSLQPFLREGSAQPKTCDIHFHDLPWPREALLALPLNTPVTMRITLSYFIEPSPGERGWDKKYGYASHGLRFRVIRASESLNDFQARVNAHGRDEDYEAETAGETGRWFLGQNRPTNGSIHSNIWQGSAQDLAARRHIAIYPTLGWWRTRPGEQRFNRRARYSIIVSISTPDENVDIYTPVAVQVGIDNLIPLEIQT